MKTFKFGHLINLLLHDQTINQTTLCSHSTLTGANKRQQTKHVKDPGKIVRQVKERETAANFF